MQLKLVRWAALIWVAVCVLAGGERADAGRCRTAELQPRTPQPWGLLRLKNRRPNTTASAKGWKVGDETPAHQTAPAQTTPHMPEAVADSGNGPYTHRARLEVSIGNALTYAATHDAGSDWVSHVVITVPDAENPEQRPMAEIWLNRATGNPNNPPNTTPDVSIYLNPVRAARSACFTPCSPEIPAQFTEYPWLLVRLKNRRTAPATSTKARQSSGGPVVHEIGPVPVGQDGESTSPLINVTTTTAHVTVTFGDGVAMVGAGGPYPSSIKALDAVECTAASGTATVLLSNGTTRTFSLSPTP